MTSVDVTLSLNTTARINRALESIDIVGERYPKHLLCVSAGVSRMSRSAASSCSISNRCGLRRVKSCSPASVGATLRVVRVSKRTPSRASGWRIAWIPPGETNSTEWLTAEHRNGLLQTRSALRQVRGGAGDVIDHGGVVVRHYAYTRDGRVYQGERLGLLLRRMADLFNQR